MDACIDLGEYMAEIREQVCTRCVDRPHGGPPCEPLGKLCGIEVNLRQLVDAVHDVDSTTMEQYEDEFHHVVCEECAFHNMHQCPCPLDSLLILAVQAIESVDRRHGAAQP